VLAKLTGEAAGVLSGRELVDAVDGGRPGESDDPVPSGLPPACSSVQALRSSEDGNTRSCVMRYSFLDHIR